MATLDTTVSTRHIPFGDFGDRRVLLMLDAEEVRMRAAFLQAPCNLFFDQSANGPTRVYLNRDVSDRTLEQLANRHGLDVAEVRTFRDTASDGATTEAQRIDYLH